MLITIQRPRRDGIELAAVHPGPDFDATSMSRIRSSQSVWKIEYVEILAALICAMFEIASGSSCIAGIVAPSTKRGKILRPRSNAADISMAT
jgi:hypothetical protein